MVSANTVILYFPYFTLYERVFCLICFNLVDEYYVKYEKGLVIEAGKKHADNNRQT
jgi:hypothetical protein